DQVVFEHDDFFNGHGFGKSRGSHLTNEREWRGQRFGLATRREEGAWPKRPATDEQRRGRAKDRPFPPSNLSLSSIRLPSLSFRTPSRSFMRWLLTAGRQFEEVGDEMRALAVDGGQFAGRDQAAAQERLLVLTIEK